MIDDEFTDPDTIFRQYRFGFASTQLDEPGAFNVAANSSGAGGGIVFPEPPAHGGGHGREPFEEIPF